MEIPIRFIAEWTVQRPAWENHRGYRLGKGMEPEELVNFQGPPSLSSRLVDPHVQEVK